MSTTNTLPLVVQVGFAGSRTLFDTVVQPTENLVAAQAELQRQLAAHIEGIYKKFGIEDHHFICGISQIAVGADTIFTRACRELGIPQRVFLPQPVSEYLSARGPAGPDFSPEERAEAEAMLEDPHIIQTRVVSDNTNREVRFEESNLEIVRVSDVLVALVREGATARPGGTEHAISVAVSRNIPVLELSVQVDPTGVVKVDGAWHGEDLFTPPALPKVLAGAGPAELELKARVPSFRAYAEGVKKYTSRVSKVKQRIFASAASTVIAAHLVATMLAAFALAFHATPALLWLLSIELVFLSFGFLVHRYLHHSTAIHDWALTRSAAEIARSVLAVDTHAYLEYLFALPYPRLLRPLFRTLSVLHLAATHRQATEDWKSKRDTYSAKRVDDQIGYMARQHARALTHIRAANVTFTVFTLLALAATAAKLSMARGWIDFAPELTTPLEHILGVLAIVLPVVAIGALSLAAALDREARVHTFGEVLDFLKVQKLYLADATSEREFVRLLLETESHLLGENANWYARRSFTGVS